MADVSKGKQGQQQQQKGGMMGTKETIGQQQQGGQMQFKGQQGQEFGMGLGQGQGQQQQLLLKSGCLGICLNDARTVIAAAQQKANELGVKIDVTVVDAGGNIVALERMDGAWPGSVRLSIDKAWTANAFHHSTMDLHSLAQPGGPLYGIHSTHYGKVVTMPGGIPLLRQGLVIGSIGVSGANGEQNHQVALAGARTLSPSESGYQEHHMTSGQRGSHSFTCTK